jgi:hypothetical protein
MAHWFTHREHGFPIERAVVADYDLSVMRLDDTAYWLVALKPFSLKSLRLKETVELVSNWHLVLAKSTT